MKKFINKINSKARDSMPKERFAGILRGNETSADLA